MLDPAMQQFADEMLARPRPRRPSTRRNAETDPSSPAGAAELGRRIQAFWNSRLRHPGRDHPRRRPARVADFRRPVRHDRRLAARHGRRKWPRVKTSRSNLVHLVDRVIRGNKLSAHRNCRHPAGICFCGRGLSRMGDYGCDDFPINGLKVIRTPDASKEGSAPFGKHLAEVMESVCGDRLRNFTSRNPADQWFIASDYVIGDKNRPHDVLCYTIYPVFQSDPTQLWREISDRIPRDLKNTSQIDDQIVASLRDDNKFSFCFVLPNARRFFRSVADARQAIDATLAIMQNCQDAAAHHDLIRRMRRLRQQAQAKGFNTKLFSDVLLVTMIAVVLAYLLTKFTRPRTIGWFSDRDSISSAFGKVAYDLFAINHAGICQQNHVPYDDVRIGWGDPRPDPLAPKRSWYDPLVRVPDFLAGALAAFNYNYRTNESGREKVTDLITKVFADAPNICVLVVSTEDNLFSFNLMTITAMQHPPGTESSGICT
jgi:hypothetical protein